MIGPLRQMRWQGARHCVDEPTPQERRVRQLLRIASRVHAKAITGWDRLNDDGQNHEMGVW